MIGFIKSLFSSQPKKETRTFRLTYYLLAEQDQFAGSRTVPIFMEDGRTIFVEPGFFASLSLQGSGKLRNGVLLNVSGKYRDVKHEDYAPVLDHHRRFLPRRPVAYSGIAVDKNEKVTRALSFREVKEGGLGGGYGMTNGEPLVPFKTLAADIGRMVRHDPNFKGKGGVVPLRTRVYMECFKGVALPDGSVHDGWFTVTDTGGGIYGAHFDVFVGTKSLKESVKIPPRAEAWFEGIESRMQKSYTYGLED